MKKFIALYCNKNLIGPAIYKTQKVAFKHIGLHPTAQYKIFTSQLEAEKFIYPKKISYLEYKQKLQKNSENAKIIQKKKAQASIENMQSNPEIKDIEGKKQVQSPVITVSGKQLNKNDRIKIKQKKTEVNESEVLNQQEKQNEKNKVEEARWLLQKQNLKQLYHQIIGYQGKANKFEKSKCLMGKKSNAVYFAFFDGASKNNPGPSGAGYLVTNGLGQKVLENAINIGTQTNNQAEYISFIICLLDCLANGIEKLTIFGDSEVVVKGVQGKYSINNKNIKQLNMLARQLIKQFEEIQIKHIQREMNKHADKLSNLGIKKKCLKNNQNSVEKPEVL